MARKDKIQKNVDKVRQQCAWNMFETTPQVNILNIFEAEQVNLC